MYLNPTQILFVEPVGPNSKVAQLIAQASHLGLVGRHGLSHHGELANIRIALPTRAFISWLLCAGLPKDVTGADIARVWHDKERKVHAPVCQPLLCQRCSAARHLRRVAECNYNVITGAKA
jgi:hypothetical protein